MTWTSHPVVTLLPASIQRREVAGNNTSPFGKNVHFSWITCPVTLPRARAEQWAAHFSRPAPRLQPVLQKQAPGLAPLTLRLQPILLPAQEISSRFSMEIILVKSFSLAIRGVMWCSFYVKPRISPRVLHASYWPWLIPSLWCAEMLCTSLVPHLSLSYCQACTLANSFGKGCRWKAPWNKQ